MADRGAFQNLNIKIREFDGLDKGATKCYENS